MTVTLSTPPLVAEYDFATGKYTRSGIGQFDPDGTHLITWLIGSQEKKSKDMKSFEPLSGIEQWVSGQIPCSENKICLKIGAEGPKKARKYGNWGYWYKDAYLADFTKDKQSFTETINAREKE